MEMKSGMMRRLGTVMIVVMGVCRRIETRLLGREEEVVCYDGGEQKVSGEGGGAIGG